MDNRRFSVSADELKVEIMRRKYCELLSHADVFPSKENWDFIIENHLTGLGDGLYRKFLVSSLLDDSQRCDYHILALESFPRYLQTIDREYAIETIYADPLTDSAAFVKLVYDCRLFDCNAISQLIDAGHLSLAVSLLDSFQPEYDGDTIDAMQFLIAKFDNLPRLGSIEFHKGIFRSENKYICPDGHVNPEDVVYCKKESCGKDIFGLTEEQRQTIEKFGQRIEILREMLD